MLKKSLLHWRLMVWAINPAGDSLFTQNNDNLSLLEVNNISLVVLLVKKKKKKCYQFKIRRQHTKVADSFGLCLRYSLWFNKDCLLIFSSKLSFSPKRIIDHWYHSREQNPNHQLERNMAQQRTVTNFHQRLRSKINVHLKSQGI